MTEQPSQLRVLPPGRSVEVEVPATSANLGPGFDCLGLALDWRDTCTFETADGSAPGADVPVVVKITGEGAGRLPTDAHNLIVRSLQIGLKRLGVRMPGLVVRVVNTIPQGRGLGSSSAAIVAGLAGAHGLARPQERFDPAEWLPVANRIEGHPDNVAAALYGGLVLAYPRADGGEVAAATAVVHPAISGLVLIPEQPLATEVARSALPQTVSHADAAANAGRAALLVHALTTAPGLLFEATEDWLHQPYRAPAMRASADLLEVLRSKRIPAVVSGAGPSLLVLGTAAEVEAARAMAPNGFRSVPVRVGDGVRLG